MGMYCVSSYGRYLVCRTERVATAINPDSNSAISSGGVDSVAHRTQKVR